MDSRRGARAVTTAWTSGWSRGWAALVAATLALVAVLAGAPVAAQGADDPRAVLSVLKSVSASSAQPGDRVTWTIDVTCESIVTMCADAVLTDAVPEPFEIVTDGVSVQGQRTGSAQVAVTGRDVRVDFRETDAGRPGAVGLAAGQSVSVLVQTTLPADLPRSWDGSTVVNTADATGSNADPVADDASIVIAVPVDPAVAVTKTWTPGDQVAGDEADQTITLGVTNRSPISATALTLTDPAAGTPASFGPGTPVVLRGFGPWTAPTGATGLLVTLITAGGPVELGPFAPGAAITTGVTDLSTVTGVDLRFLGDTTAAGTIEAGAAGSVALVLGQDGSAARDVVTRVPNTAAGAVATTEGDAAGTAFAELQINPVTVEVTPGKTVEGRAQAQVVAGADAVVRLTATNSSNTTLASLTVREPATGTDPFGTTADGKLALTGLGTDGDGAIPASAWPQGATSAVVTLRGTGPGLPLTTTVTPAADGSSVWPAVPAGATVTGLDVEYRGAMAPGASATLPFVVATDETWDTVHGFPNTVAVGGTATDTTVAAERTATATLTVVPRRVVTTTSKTLTQQANGSTVTGAVGQEIVARLTGRISADTTVPVGRLVIEDVAGAGSTLWDVAEPSRIGSVQVPSGAQAEVLVRTGGTWTSIAGPTADATALLDLAVPAGADGVRIVYTPTAVDGSLPIDGTFTPAVALVMALTETVAPGTTLTNTAGTTGEGTGDGAGLTGVSDGPAGVTVGPGTTPLDIRQVDASKEWRDAAALIPVGNTTAADGDRPTNRLTMRVQNVSGIPVGTLRLVDPDLTAGAAEANAFAYVDLTHLTVTAPAGTQSLRVLLSDADGTVLRTLTSAAQVAALTRADLADVVRIEAQADGTIPDGARLVVVADTELRSTTRDGAPIAGTADAPPSTLLRNTLHGDLGAGTPDDAAQAETLLYPEAQQPLDGALAKSVSPSTVSRYAAEERTVRLALSARRTSDAAVSRPAQYMLEDTTAAFWDQVDLVGLQALSGITAADGSGWTAAVQYQVDGAWSTAVTSALVAGTATTMPTLAAGAADLPDDVAAGDVTGVRITFTAPEGRWFLNRSVGGFEGPTALFTLSPRSTLRSTGAEVPAGTVDNVLTGSVQGTGMATPIDLDPVTAPYTVTDGTPDATVTKTPVTTTTGPGTAIPFTLTATSTGTAPVVDPVLTDVLPSDASGPLLVHDADAYGDVTVRVTPDTAAAAQVEPTVTVDGDQIRVTFPAGTRLLPGERVVVTVPLAVRPGTPAGAVLTNRFVLTAADDLVREATATVDVVAMATYLRVKDVAEDVAPGGTPTGVVSTVGGDCVAADGFYRNPCLVATAPGGTETWRLRVTNTGNLPTAAISLVDVLPFDGDTGTSRSQSSSPRGSTWAPEYLGDLQVTGVPAGGTTTVSYLLDGQTCRFSGDPRSADPYGTDCAADVWTPADQVDDLSAVRGVRVDVDLAAENLQPGETVTVAFRTRSVTPTADDATGAAAPAWNTMVVHTASVGTAGLVHETLEPNRAGVFVQPVADPGTTTPGTTTPPVTTTPGTTTPGPDGEVLGETVTSEVSAVSEVLAVTGTEAAALVALALAALGLGGLLLRTRHVRAARRR